ncbi:MAG TPA: hypothetical protein VHI71_09640 [Actinomycetota bacterium]|nr:hypothetical protein [Actinomycetota bacterium]
MRIAVEAWSPEYGAGVDLRERDDETVENIRTDWEAWAPVPCKASAPGISSVAFVDGVRRVDARIHLDGADAIPRPGAAASIGVGVLVCSAAGGAGTEGGVAPVMPPPVISRYLAVAAPRVPDLPVAPGVHYAGISVDGDAIDKVEDAIHDTMRRTEADAAVAAAGHPDRIVFADGPLAKMKPGPLNVVGYIKSHARPYLDEPERDILGSLGCGERTPLFSFGERRPRFSWYLRLCERDRDSHGWHGIVRCEVPYALGVDRAVELADASTALLPRFASKPHWDKRAPQNLVPIACLERRLRHLLSDPLLIHRAVKSAAIRSARKEAAVA